MAEGTRLLSGRGSKARRGFESRPLRRKALVFGRNVDGVSDRSETVLNPKRASGSAGKGVPGTESALEYAPVFSHFLPEGSVVASKSGVDH